MYIIREREAGNMISKHDTLAEAYETLELYETADMNDGTYTDNFYEIVGEE